jgi:putative SOS response-associated peptidase YedK
MCGRYSITTNRKILVDRFQVLKAPATLPPRYNLAPTQMAPVIVYSSTLSLMKWGLIPHWSKDCKIGQKMINARAESLREKRSFYPLLKQHRCLVPADGFYEWSKTGKSKTAYRFELPDRRPFAFAGLWTTWQEIHSFTIITTHASREVASVHSRMPLILKQENETRWLDPAEQEIEELLTPDPDVPLERYAVNPIVGNVTNDGPECLQPADNL